MKKLKAVMVIDDDPICSWLNKTILEDLEVIEEIDCYQDSKVALDYLLKINEEHLIEEACPDIIFLDIQMPNINGFDFLDQLSMVEKCQSICKQVVILSSSMHQEDIARASLYGIHAYLVKPLTPAQARVIVNDFIRGSV